MNGRRWTGTNCLKIPSSKAKLHSGSCSQSAVNGEAAVTCKPQRKRWDSPPTTTSFLSVRSCGTGEKRCTILLPENWRKSDRLFPDNGSLRSGATTQASGRVAGHPVLCRLKAFSPSPESHDQSRVLRQALQELIAELPISVVPLGRLSTWAVDPDE